MPRSCSCRCWSAPRDAVKCSGRWRAFRPSSCCARSTRCSSSARCAPSSCSVVRCTSTRRGTEMTVGVPGTGIGGMFYLAGALLAAIWVTGWLVGIAITASAAIIRPPHLLAGAHPGNVLRTAALVLSAATLAAVLLGVELLRLWVHRGTGRGRAATAGEAGSRQQIRRVAALVLFALAADGTDTVAAQNTSALARRLARADSAFAVGDATAAEREYAAALAVDPENSRATYRLADLSKRGDPARALQLFRRYVALEPSDPWGYMALGDAFARSGSYGDALRSYDDALRLAPDERDAVIGRARVLARAGRTDAAVAGYRHWLDANPSDAEAWGDLGRQ